jgi:hypothetical protein
MTIDGPAGSGKSYTALRFAHALASGGKIAAIDTERGSLSKYVGDKPDEVVWNFDVVELKDFSPEKYTEMIQAAGKMGYAVLVIDSLSHAWEGVGGALEIKDRQGGNQWTAWRNVTPIHNRMIDAILQSPCHVITTMRSRMEYVQETDDKGKINIRKVGMAPIQRPGMEYEFDIVADMDWSHILTVSKSRCSAVADMKVEKPGPYFLQPVMDWLQSGNATTYPEKAEQFTTTSNNGDLRDRDLRDQKTFDALIAEHKPELVMNAMQKITGGQMPQTQEEINKIEQEILLAEIGFGA